MMRPLFTIQALFMIEEQLAQLARIREINRAHLASKPWVSVSATGQEVLRHPRPMRRWYKREGQKLRQLIKLWYNRTQAVIDGTLPANNYGCTVWQLIEAEHEHRKAMTVVHGRVVS